MTLKNPWDQTLGVHIVSVLWSLIKSRHGQDRRNHDPPLMALLCLGEPQGDPGLGGPGRMLLQDSGLNVTGYLFQGLSVGVRIPMQESNYDWP